MKLKDLSLSIEMKRNFLVSMGHNSAAFMPEHVIQEWYSNYINTLNNLDLSSPIYSDIANCIADIILLDEVEYIDETEGES